MNNNSGGIGLGTVLFVAFLILKLTHVIDWSWWWITAPLWIPFGMALIFMTFAAFFMATVAGLSRRK